MIIEGDGALRLLQEALEQSGGGRPEVKTPSEEVQVMELQLLADNYGKTPFKPRQLVTPKKNAPLNGQGLPHIVLEVFEDRIEQKSENERFGSPGLGAKYDIRVAGFAPNTGSLVMWLGESEYYEPWIPGEAQGNA